jgi:hypothetical protein
MSAAAACLASNGSETPEDSHLPEKIIRKVPVTISTILTKQEFLLLAKHMGNGNAPSHFLTVWRDDKGNARYAKAKRYKRVKDHASWTWDTIIGQSKRKTSMGFYAKNQNNQSTWGALDFDAHSGNHELAKDRATSAFSLLREYRDRYLILSASGRGYHVFIFALEPRPVAEWAKLLKETAESAGAPLEDGVCETFPNENTEKQCIGRAIRVPGSFNPHTDDVALILADTIRPLVDHLSAKEKDPKAATLRTKPNFPHELLRDREADNYSNGRDGFLSASTGKLIDQVVNKHPIQAKSTRNGILMKLTGELFHKFGRQLSERVVRQHYDVYESNVTTPLKEHMHEFAEAWQSILKKTKESLTLLERGIFDQLTTEPQQQQFSDRAVEPRRSTEY